MNSKPERIQMPLRLDADLVAQIDERRKPLNLSRNEWITNLVKWALVNTKTIQDRDERLRHNAGVTGGPHAVDTPDPIKGDR